MIIGLELVEVSLAAKELMGQVICIILRFFRSASCSVAIYMQFARKCGDECRMCSGYGDSRCNMIVAGACKGFNLGPSSIFSFVSQLTSV